MRSGEGATAPFLAFPDGGVTIVDGLADDGQGGGLDGVEFFGMGGDTDFEEFVGFGGVGGEVGVGVGEDFLEDAKFILGGLKAGGAEPGEVDAIVELGFFQDGSGGEFAGGFDEVAVVEEDEGGGGAVGAAAFHAANFERGLVEDGHIGLWFGALPVAVNGAAVDVVGAFLAVAIGSVRVDGRAAVALDEEAGGGEGGIADFFAAEAVGRSAGEELVGDVAGLQVGGVGGLLTEGGGENDLTYDFLRTPPLLDEVAREPVEECGVGGEISLQSEIFGGANDTVAKEVLPDPVDVDTGGQGVLGEGEPLSEAEAVARGVCGEGDEEIQGVASDEIFRSAFGVEISTFENVGGSGNRHFLHDGNFDEGVFLLDDGLLGGREFSDGFAVFVVMVGEVVRIKFVVRESGKIGGESGDLANLWRSEGAVEGFEFIDVSTFEAWATKDSAEGEGPAGVGSGVDAFEEFVIQDSGFDEPAVEVEFEAGGS